MKKFPRLLLIADVPIALGGRSSSEALARIFQNYPADSLMIVQTQGALPEPEKRVPCREYRLWAVPWDSLLFSRLTIPANIFKVGYSVLRAKGFALSTGDYIPDAIVTLVHGNGWVLALRIAEQMGIPLHLIIHDGPVHFQLNYPITGRFLTNEFIRACKQASSRWSICSALDQHIERITGVPGQVLPPLRRADDLPQCGLENNFSTNKAIYFGALSSVSVTSMMNDVSRELSKFGGGLHAYGDVSPNVLASIAWKNRTFQHHGSFGDRNKFLEHCRRSYDFMYLPFSFEDDDMRFSFPSKLVDYSLACLPILVQAPPSSAVNVWCLEHSEAALLVSEKGQEALRLPIKALVESADLKLRLARGAQLAGESNFEFERHWRRLLETIYNKTKDDIRS